MLFFRNLLSKIFIGICTTSGRNTLSKLFNSEIKFKSSSGWPSFTQPLQNNAIKYKKDHTHGMQRIEVMCNTCDAHLGHVFPDGPKPTGLRYCINSVSMDFIPEGE